MTSSTHPILDDQIPSTMPSVLNTSNILCNSWRAGKTPLPLLTMKYRLQDGLLGSGSFSTTRCAIDISTNVTVAVKIYSAESSRLYTELGSQHCSQNTELQILQRLHHPNVISLLDVAIFESSFVLVLEYLDGGDLFHYIEARTFLPEPCAVAVLHPCLQALAYVHRCSVCHRDIKPENIMLFTTKNGTIDVKLIDFGLSAFVTKITNDIFETPSLDSINEKCKSLLDCATWCGSLQYIAPEIIKARDNHDRYSFPVDIYALGVTLYVMTCGSFPFVDANGSDDVDLENHLASILAGAWSFDSAPHRDATPLLRSLISSMLCVSQELRSSAVTLLDHPWLSRFFL